jgi:hypothetical protein
MVMVLKEKPSPPDGKPSGYSSWKGEKFLQLIEFQL